MMLTSCDHLVSNHVQPTLNIPTLITDMKINNETDASEGDGGAGVGANSGR